MERNRLEDQSIDEGKILNWILRMDDVKVFIGFSWLTVRNSYQKVKHSRFAYYVKEIILGSQFLTALSRL
jgi:hypothetical protein